MSTVTIEAVKSSNGVWIAKEPTPVRDWFASLPMKEIAEFAIDVAALTIAIGILTAE